MTKIISIEASKYSIFKIFISYMTKLDFVTEETWLKMKYNFYLFFGQKLNLEYYICVKQNFVLFINSFCKVL